MLTANELNGIRDLMDKAIKECVFPKIRNVRSALALRDRLQETICEMAAENRESRAEFEDFKRDQAESA